MVFCFAGHHNGICSTCCLFSSAMLLTFVVDGFLLINNALVSDEAFELSYVHLCFLKLVIPCKSISKSPFDVDV